MIVIETIRYIVCERCGKRVKDGLYNMTSSIYKKMIGECICWECAFWSNIVAEKEKYDVIDGRCYMLLPEQEKNKLALYGMGGKTFCIMRKDFTAIRTNDAWPIGKVPESFRKELPDTAWIITLKAYNAIRKRGNICTNRYCMDRYHCLFYKWWDEEDAEMISSIPKDWHTGDELCPSFVDFNRDIRNFWDFLEPVNFDAERKKRQRLLTKKMKKNGKNRKQKG